MAVQHKILCPSDTHRGYEKILLGIDSTRKEFPRSIYVHCGDMKCRTWYRVTFNSRRGISVTRLPKTHHFDFAKAAVLVADEPLRKANGSNR